jgi:hypothetical protein
LLGGILGEVFLILVLVVGGCILHRHWKRKGRSRAIKAEEQPRMDERNIGSLEKDENPVVGEETEPNLVREENPSGVLKNPEQGTSGTALE